MQIFLDTADLNEIKYFSELGIIDGITTNPSLLSGQNYIKVAKEICSIMKHHPVSLEVISTDYEGMIKEGMQLKTWANNVVVKLPMTAAGLQACGYLTSQNVAVNITLCFSAAQALLAAKAGAIYVSVFVGRQDDLGVDGMQIVSKIMEIYKQYVSIIESELIVASIRSPFHVVRAAQLGADACTVPPAILRQMLSHPMTEKGVEKFLADWHKAEVV